MEEKDSKIGMKRRTLLTGSHFVAATAALLPERSAAAEVAAGAECAPSVGNPAATDKFPPLPPFKFSLENSNSQWKGKGGTAKEVNVSNFPISQSIAGVSMRLQPGGLRELHWHGIAAEWAY